VFLICAPIAVILSDLTSLDDIVVPDTTTGIKRSNPVTSAFRSPWPSASSGSEATVVESGHEKLPVGGHGDPGWWP
jgi:hypothetical protein